MKYLLDTHSFLWTLFDDAKLPERAREIIKDPDNDIFVSVTTNWEISLKYAIGKLEFEGITPDELPEKSKMIGIETLQILEEEASSFYRLQKTKHKDPFDRMIIWQAIKRNLTLISKDEGIKIYKPLGLKFLWK